MTVLSRQHAGPSLSALLLIPLVSALALPPQPSAKRTRGLWVWESSRLLHDEHAQVDFLDFCQHHGIGVVSVQVRAAGTGSQRHLDDERQWKTLIKGAHRRGMRVHALDGDPNYARPAQRGVVLSIDDAIVAFDAAASPAERFDGIHLDIEPYLLPEWAEPRTREPLLADYLQVNELSAAKAHAAGLRYTVDLPFWWYETDPATGEPVSVTTYHGVRRPAPDHLLEIVDNLGLMAYRRVASGSDGVVALATQTIEHADASGKVKVFVGVETEEPSTHVPAKVTFAGASLDQMNKELAVVDDALNHHPSFSGIAIHRYATYRVLADRTALDRTYRIEAPK